ncbi:MAG TPA: dihydrolipoyl dehydrogenase, partial [Nitrospiria bacterium]
GVVPSGIFTIPEIGTVGLKEWEARERGLEVRVGRYPFRALGRAQTMDETAGLVKVIADAKTDRVLGAQIIGPHASDLIHEAALAIRLGGRAEDLSGMIHAHPTLSEAVMEASEDLHGVSVHQMRKASPK